MAMHKDTARFNALIMGERDNIYVGLPEEAVADFKNAARDIINPGFGAVAQDKLTPAMFMLSVGVYQHAMHNHDAFHTISAMVMASDVDKDAQLAAAQLLVMLPGPKIMDHYHAAARLIVQQAESPGPLQPVALATLHHINAPH